MRKDGIRYYLMLVAGDVNRIAKAERLKATKREDNSLLFIFFYI